MPHQVTPHSSNISEVAASINVYPHTKNNITPILILGKLLKFILKYFGYIQTCQPTFTWYLRINFVLPLMLAYKQNLNLVSSLILEILLIYHFEVLRAYSIIPKQTLLIFINQFVASMDVFPHPRNLFHTLKTSDFEES